MDIYSRIQVNCERCGFLFGSCEKNVMAETNKRARDHATENHGHHVVVELISVLANYPVRIKA